MNIIDSTITKECLDTLLANHSVERTAFDVAQLLYKLEKFLPKEVYKTLGTSKMLIFVNYKIVPNLTMVDLKGVTISYVQGNGIVHEEVNIAQLIDTLEELEIFSLEYIPLMNALNIKTIPYIRQIAKKYPKQLSNAIEESQSTDLVKTQNRKPFIKPGSLSTNISTNICYDYLKQFSHWWKILKDENYSLIGKSQIKRLVSHMIPIAIFTERDDTSIGKVIQECIQQTILQEHFHMDMFERHSKKTGITTMVTIYWVSFKNAMEFLDTDKHTVLSPITILETLLANFGYVESNLCALNQKQYIKNIDQYGIERFVRLNPVTHDTNQADLPTEDLSIDLESLLGDYSDINDSMTSNEEFTFKEMGDTSGLLDDII